MKHRIKSTKAGQAYVSMRGWHKASPPRSGRDSQVGLGDTPDEDMQELQRENSDEYEADWETLSDLDDASKNLAKAVDQAVSWMGDVEPAEYDERTRRELLRGDVSDIIDAFTEVNNAIASTDWETSSRKSGKPRGTKKGSAYNAALRNLEMAASAASDLNDDLQSAANSIDDTGLLDDTYSASDYANDINEWCDSIEESFKRASGALRDLRSAAKALERDYGSSRGRNRTDPNDLEKSRRTLKARAPNASQALRAMANAQDAVSTYVETLSAWVEGADAEGDDVGIMDDARTDVSELRRGVNELSDMVDDAEGQMP